MRLLRVQVPEFRALKNVDISFEPEFTPQVFPLGSLNGGGKSTLLQLIFVLLHCSAHEEQYEEHYPFIENMLDGITIPEGETSKLLARFELLENETTFELEFIVCNDSYLQQLDINPVFNKKEISFTLFNKQEKIRNEKNKLEKLLLDEGGEIIEDDDGVPIGTTQQPSDEFIYKIQREIKEIDSFLKNIDPLMENIIKNINLKNQIYIAVRSKSSIGLICQFLDNKLKLNKKRLEYISKKVFLSSPTNQIYLFLDKSVKKSLFSNSRSYENALNTAKKELENFVTYDIFSAEKIVTLFEKARNQDFKIFVETGENGSHYKKLVEELSLFANKKIIPQIDENSKVTGVIFKSHEGVELYPEDLSHGELKRLSIYAWLKTMPQGENIVLFDEIENGFHPRWQRYIVDDLVEWGETNQYILATHSYEVCRGVSFGHIKELAPKLMPELSE